MEDSTTYSAMNADTTDRELQQIITRMITRGCHCGGLRKGTPAIISAAHLRLHLARLFIRSK